jgi:hypothetical protein
VLPDDNKLLVAYVQDEHHPEVVQYYQHKVDPARWWSSMQAVQIISFKKLSSDA